MAASTPNLSGWIQAIMASIASAQADFHHQQWAALTQAFTELPPGWAQENAWLGLHQATIRFALKPARSGWRGRCDQAWRCLRGKAALSGPLGWEAAQENEPGSWIIELQFGVDGITRATQTSTDTGETHVLQTT